MNHDIMQHILYILPMLKEEGFKVGITSLKDLSRINHLHKLYNFDLKQSYIVLSSERIIKMLERQLLTDYSVYHFNTGNGDGHTEFLNKQCFLNVLEDIRHKQRLSHIQMNVTKGIDLVSFKKQKHSGKIQSQRKNEWVYDFTALDHFVNIVRKNSNILSISIENKVANGVKGSVITLYSSNIGLVKNICQQRFIEYGSNEQDIFAFITGAEYDKVNSIGQINLAGMYHDFKNEYRIKDEIVFNKLNQSFYEIKNIIKIKQRQK